MKTKNLLLCMLVLVTFHAKTIAQGFSCGDFVLQSIEPDSSNANTLQLGISFNAGLAMFAHLPHVRALLNCNGDTVGQGDLFFFGQGGQTVLQYPVSITGLPQCQPLTAVFVFSDGAGNTDTCLLSFGVANIGLSGETNRKLLVYPNPAHHELTIHASPAYIGEVFKVYNHLGMLVDMGKIEAESTRLNIAHAAAGMYFIRIGEQRQSIARFMKE